MAEVGNSHRITKIIPTSPEDPLWNKAQQFPTLGGIVLGGIIADDGLPGGLKNMILPVVQERLDGTLVVPTHRVAAELAKLGVSRGDTDLRSQAAGLGSHPQALLLVPPERVVIREPL